MLAEMASYQEIKTVTQVHMAVKCTFMAPEHAFLKSHSLSIFSMLYFLVPSENYIIKTVLDSVDDIILKDSLRHGLCLQ